MAILKINDDRSKKQTAISNSSYQAKTFSSATVLYCSKAELPSSLSHNALIFTYDTAELYVGTGSGIKKLKLGSEEDLNPKIFLRIDDAKKIYKTISSADEDIEELTTNLQTLDNNVYSKEEIDQFLTEDVDLDGVIDRLDTYTVAKINELFDEKAAAADVYTQEQVNTLISAAKVEAETSLNTVKTELSTVISSLEEHVDEADQELGNDIAEKVQTLTAKIDTDIATAKEELSATISTLSDEVATNKEVLTQKINTDIATLSDSITTELTSIKADITTLNTSLEEKVAELNDSLTEKAGQLDNKITENVATLESSITSLDNSLTGQITNVSDTLTAQISELEDSLTDSIKTTDDYAKVVNSKINNLQKKVYTKEETYSRAQVDALINSAVSEVITAIVAAINGEEIPTPPVTPVIDLDDPVDDEF